MLLFSLLPRPLCIRNLSLKRDSTCKFHATRKWTWVPFFQDQRLSRTGPLLQGIAARLLQHPRSTTDELLSCLCEADRQRHTNNARAIAELDLPDCKESWFSPSYRHLRHCDWGAVLPFFKKMGTDFGPEKLHKYMQNSSLCNGVITNKEGADIVSKWMNKLTGDKAKIMNGDSFWALLGKCTQGGRR